jgi:hypothetical protein
MPCATRFITLSHPAQTFYFDPTSKSIPKLCAKFESSDKILRLIVTVHFVDRLESAIHTLR